MSFPLPPLRIAHLLECPLANLEVGWPLIEQCLHGLGIGTNRCCIAALATVRVECPPFKPVKEYGGELYHRRMYDTTGDRPELAKALGNTEPGDGPRYCGRGFIQITGKRNYNHYGHLLGADLVKDPDLALEPNTAAAILAAYFKEKKVDVAAELRDWRKVRRLVNGGYNGLPEFLEYVAKLEADVLTVTQYEGNT